MTHLPTETANPVQSSNPLLWGVPSESCSAAIELTLICGEQRFELSQVGGGKIYLRDDVQVPAGPAEVELKVDGKPYRWRVEIPETTGRVIPVELSAETMIAGDESN